jgi:HlyD family secretion protein
VPETALGKVKPGMPVTVSTDTPGGRAYTAQVGFVSPTAEFTPRAVETPELRSSLVYRVRLIVQDADDGLRQGMPVTISLDEPGKAG